MLRVLLVIAALFAVPGQAYSKYAKPIQFNQKKNDEPYFFDLTISQKLTMSYKNNETTGYRTPVDYIPESKIWKRRDPNQLVNCFQNFTMTDGEKDQFLDDVILLDGLHKRVISINGRLPGEPLVVEYNKQVWIRVNNKILLDSATIHVHGIDKKKMWFMDGVAFVQQCPIQTTNRFDYRFIADNKGTHWFHGHLQTDRGEGLAGGFIVIDPTNRTVPTIDKKRVTPDTEYFMMIQDWALKSGEDSWLQLQEKTMKWMYGFENFDKCWEPTRTSDGGNVGGAAPLSAIIVNGKGWHDQAYLKSKPHNLPLERFLVNKSENVLFRIVNSGLAQELMLTVEQHKIVVVAADGDEVVPMEVDHLIIFPGERYDVLIQTKDKPEKRSYRIQIETIQRYFFDWKTIERDYTFAYIDYNDDSLKDINEKNPDIKHSHCKNKSCTVLNCPFGEWGAQPGFKCIAYNELENPFADEIEENILKATEFTEGYEEYFINMHHDSQMDQFKFEFPWGIPYYHNSNLSRISTPCEKTECVNSTTTDNDNKCRCFYHLTHKLNNIVQLTFYNMGLGGFMGTGYAHPFHMHGHHFYVMKVGWPKYNATGFIEELNHDIDCDTPDKPCYNNKWRNTSWMNGAVEGMNTKNPTRRDTVTIPVGGYMTIRFNASNPGWWFAHCHLELHLMGGTGYAYRVGEHSEIYMPPKDFPKDCGVFETPEFPELIVTGNGVNRITSSLIGIMLISILFIFQ